jgi:hypothetical protein
MENKTRIEAIEHLKQWLMNEGMQKCLEELMALKGKEYVTQFKSLLAYIIDDAPPPPLHTHISHTIVFKNFGEAGSVTVL